MGDVVSVVESRGFLKNIMDSVVGALVGVVLFFASFALLYWNEGRPNLASVAKTSVVASADKVDPAVDGKFVSVSGAIQSKDDDVGDPGFVKPSAWIRLERHVETFAWKETSESRTDKNVGGSSTTTTTYRYAKEWCDSVPDSGRFHEPAGHQNLAPSLSPAAFAVAVATVGAYSFETKEAEVDADAPVAVTTENTLAGVDSSTAAAAGTTAALAKPAPRIEKDATKSYLYVGAGTMASPQLGDQRLHYTALARGALVTLFGQTKGAEVHPFAYEEGKTFLRALTGNREEAIHTLAVEDAILRWILRAVGFFCMWFGMTLVFGPLEAVANVLPFAGDVTKAAVGCLTFPIALGLTTVTVVVSMILHSLVATVIAGLVVFGIVLAVLKAKRSSAVSAQSS